MIRDELLDIIDQAAREEWTELDLRDQEVAELPPEIGRLTHLEKLLVGSNTPGRRNPLIDLPLELSKLANLQSLSLCRNQLTSIPIVIYQLPNLLSLDLSRNRIKSVPTGIDQLINLQFLEIGQNQLVSVCPEIGKLVSLISLRLYNNRLTSLPSEIGQLSNLEFLRLGHNLLRTIPGEIGQLIFLQVLHLGGNELTSLPQTVGQIANLKQIYVNANKLTVLPPEIGHLSSLEILDLSDNQLTSIPLEVGQLTSLQELKLSGNLLKAMPETVSQLTDLQQLSLYNNRFTVVPKVIGQLVGLQTLDLSNNQITVIPATIGQLANLQKLDLSNNRLTMLPLMLSRLPQLLKLHLYGNPLPVPLELLGDRRTLNAPLAILDAYFQASRPLREAKLLLIGEGDVGKTATINRLLHNRFSETRSKTIGVDIHRWAVETGNGERGTEGREPFSVQRSSLRVNIWDFGGQEIYHTTHQFFLTHRSLYLLVLDATKDEAANRLDYWLRHIQSFADDAPIILVVNKTDQHRLALDERSLLLKYPAICAIRHISCKSGAGIPELRQAIEETLAALPHVNDWIPVTWFAVKEKLAATGKDFLPYESYVDLCEAEGITHEAAQRTLARFLHDLGAALHFHDDRRLAGTNVLNPEWVTGGIYAILNEQTLQERGILRLSDLDKILNPRRYPAHKHPFLLDIMGKFELAAPLADGQGYLIPGLLPKTRPDFPWPANASVALEYRYAILPAAVLSRLMVRLHHHTWQSNGQPIRWRNGLGITRDGCRALIVADPDAARLTIALDGPAPHRRHLLAVIRADLDEIHGSFARLEAKQWVPIPGYLGVAIAYDDLLFYESEREWTPLFAPIRGRIDVRALLDGIESPEERGILALVNVLQQRFDKAELRQLAFEVLVDHEDLPGETKSDLARELALRCQRHGRLAELEERVRGERPLL